MAHIYLGNRPMVDPVVLEAAERLPDDFWVFAEFTMGGRNVDWLVIRPVPDDAPPDLHATITVTELKRTTLPLDGGDQGPWRELRDSEWVEIIPSNRMDQNYYWQLINTCNECRDWLFNNHRRFMPPGAPVNPQSFRPWPMLLILSPEDIDHRLPLSPQSRYGSFHYDLVSWQSKLLNWRSRSGVKLTEQDVRDLARVLALQEHSSPRVAPGLPVPGDVAAEAPVQERAPQQESPESFPLPDAAWVEGFAAWVASVEARLARLEAHPSAVIPGDAVAAPPQAPAAGSPHGPPVVEPGGGVRQLDERERALIVAALNNVRHAYRTRDFPSFFKEMQILIGEPLRARDYNGFGSARRFMNQAVAEGIVAYGPLDNNGVPTLYFPEELADRR
ncbi:MAG: hypothetical protein QM692_22560 [Thermomicrobiales bacterium]